MPVSRQLQRLGPNAGLPRTGEVVLESLRIEQVETRPFGSTIPPAGVAGPPRRPHGQICWAELLSALLCEGKQSWWNDGNFHSSTLCTSTIDYWSPPPTTILSICQSMDGKSTATFEGDTDTAACGTHLSPGPTLPTAIWLSLVERNSQVPTDATGTSASISGNAWKNRGVMPQDCRS